MAFGLKYMKPQKAFLALFENGIKKIFKAA
jgi:hypothetical protein